MEADKETQRDKDKQTKDRDKNIHKETNDVMTWTVDTEKERTNYIYNN